MLLMAVPSTSRVLQRTASGRASPPSASSLREVLTAGVLSLIFVIAARAFSRPLLHRCNSAVVVRMGIAGHVSATVCVGTAYG